MMGMYNGHSVHMNKTPQICWKRQYQDLSDQEGPFSISWNQFWFRPDCRDPLQFSLSSGYSYSPQTRISTLLDPFNLLSLLPLMKKRHIEKFKHLVQKRLSTIITRSIILHRYANEGQKRRKENGKKKKAILSAKKGKAAAALL